MRRRSEELDLDRYDTDKVPNGYLRTYDRIFEELIDRPVKVLELGVRTGGSLRLWRDYFPNGTIAGLDVEPPAAEPNGGRIRIYQGRQRAPSVPSKLPPQHAPHSL